MISTLVAACHQASCRPPVSGGTGGSSPSGFDAMERVVGEKIQVNFTLTETGKNHTVNVTTRGEPGDPRFQKPAEALPGTRKQVASMIWGRETGEIKGIVVEAPYQRKGIATALLQHVSSEAKERGFSVPKHSDTLTSEGRAWRESKKVSEVVFACYERACRPPTSGGTGGSSPGGYQISHRPTEGGPKAYDLLEGDISPSDIYTHPSYYTSVDKADVVARETMKQLARVRGNPDAEITIYRAGPIHSFNDGDWVTLSPTYAKGHMGSQQPDEGGWGVHSETVRAKEVRWAADDLAEWGYFPSHTDAPVELALTAACHERSCRPPTSGGTGGSSKKGGGEPYNTDGVPFRTENGWAIKAANNVVLTASFSVVNPPYDPDPTSDIDNIWDGVAKDALLGLKMAYDYAPTQQTPKILIGDFSTHEGLVKTAAAMADKYREVYVNPTTGERMSPKEVAGRLGGLVYSATTADNAFPKGVIGINASQFQYGIHLNGHVNQSAMPEANLTSPAFYTAVHEYGHHRWWNGPDGRVRRRTEEIFDRWKDSYEMSPYGKTNMLEGHAEAFAAWVIGKHEGTPSEITDDYQDQFGWGEPGEAGFSVENLAVDDTLLNPDVIAIVLDTADGPAYQLKDGRVILHKA